MSHGVKISELPAGSALGGAEGFPAVQSGTTVEVTATQIKEFAQKEFDKLVNSTKEKKKWSDAELTIALILALLRRVAEGDRLIRRGERWIWAPNRMLGRGLAGLALARSRRAR